ncbi:hypothetical protein SAMN04488581_2634 [Mycolicibacterium neoaurum]|nr:hypothetical protein SAMN04488581_2634 [Mycolicibacterium neoaurum]
MSRRVIKFYDPVANNYDLAKDPRCLFGWGPPSEENQGTPKSCRCDWGHVCVFQFGHTGKCWDGVEQPTPSCSRTWRPADWDSKQREECNRDA